MLVSKKKQMRVEIKMIWKTNRKSPTPLTLKSQLREEHWAQKAHKLSLKLQMERKSIQSHQRAQNISRLLDLGQKIRVRELMEMDLTEAKRIKSRKGQRVIKIKELMVKMEIIPKELLEERVKEVLLQI